MGLYLKDPAASIDYTIDWSAGYLGTAVLADSQWSIQPQQPQGLAALTQSFSDRQSTVTLGGGLCGAVYRVTNRVTLNDGRSDERSLTIRVGDR